MATEQLQGIVWLIIGVVSAAAVVYSMRRRKLVFPAYRVWLLLLFISSFVVRSFEGDAVEALFVWWSSIILVSLVFDTLVSLGKELNEKLAMSSMLVVTSVGGILANLYIFSTPTSVGARIFSVSTLILVHVPLLFAVITYVLGKRKLSKKFIKTSAFVSYRGMRDGNQSSPS